jgi:hypothetical protein
MAPVIGALRRESVTPTCLLPQKKSVFSIALHCHLAYIDRMVYSWG